MNFWIGITIALLINGAFGAFISKSINNNTLPWYATCLSGCVGGLIWGFMITSKKPLIYLSVLFDVITALTYIGLFILLGDKVTKLQVIGIVMSIIGVILVSE